MNGLHSSHNREDDPPRIPPSDRDDADEPPPPPPVKNIPPPIDTAASLAVPELDPTLPMTPISPSLHPPRSPAADGKPKKVNPLTDLVETEKVYVDLLTGIIRKVAAAWSRSNLPPPELDSMFRSIEGVYRANRSLLSKLKEIGSNPSSPKALGDLLMRWIDDLETPYTTYSVKYYAGFDEWEPVQSNPRLRTTLAMFSSSNPPPLPPSSDPHPSQPPIWSLTDLFLLPKERLKYYRKLYSRLLKSTTPGRSDHRLLTGALEKLDSLLATLDQRATLYVGSSSQPPSISSLPAPPPPPPPAAEDEVVIDMRTRDSNGNALKGSFIPPIASHRESDSTAGSGSFTSGLSQDTSPTSEERGPISKRPTTIAELESRMSSERTLDIFTMKPKEVRLQLSPPTLTYTRELRIGSDVVLNLTPRATGIEVVHDRGHLIVLTDLLVICERMTMEEMNRSGGPDLWLLYPPLAGKHLRVVPVEGSDTDFTITILKKETLNVHTDSPHLRDRLFNQLRECIETGATVAPSKNAPLPPPVPSLPRFNNGQPGPGRSTSMSPPIRGEMQDVRPNGGPQPQSLDSRVMSPPPNGIPPMGFPPRSSSAAPGPPMNRGYAPGQIMTSFGPGQTISPPPISPMNSKGPGAPIVAPPRGASRAVTPGGPPLPPMPHGGPPMPQGSPIGGHYMGMSPRQGPPYGGPPGPGMHMGGFPPPGPPHHQPQYGGPGPPYQQPHLGGPPDSRPSSDGSFGGSSLRHSPSSRSVASQYDQIPMGNHPPMPGYHDPLPPPRLPFARSNSSTSLNSLHAPKPLLPSAQASMRSVSTVGSFIEPSPPTSPVEERQQHSGPVTSTIAAQMKCKVFLKQQHAQWKNLGGGKLVLYRQSPTNVKQLVVEADNSKKTMLISTIVLADGVERVGKTGVAIELSDNGQRTGIVYMLQLRNETSAGGLFDTLLAGSDRSR
ncbi:hypothetical protein BXZ70DRAFT_1006358 [Cristinia sonorae]|uniref:DH domain-containing protein n=1 Tax=Cristinia sonorae TaxID=1940300 RepID=A0A8K0UTP8_9AGAR|nr:hypothetical protein BXZ70DRAFT_1006358 [Cristinia sonorae]